MKFKSTIFAQTSGSLAGKTFAHNQGGLYTRARAIPVNPNTFAQQNVRNALKTLTGRWGSAVTAAQRAAWATYAANVPLINTLGDARPIGALSMYVRCNVPRLSNEGTAFIVDDGPTVYSLGTFSAPSPTRASANFSIAYTNTDDWAIADGGFLFAYVSKPQSKTINFFKGPYLFLGEVAGNTMTPPTSPAVMTPAQPAMASQRYFFRFNASNADGRLTSSIFLILDT